MEQCLRRMWEHFTVKGVWAKAVLSDAEKERQEGIQGNWQKESPFKQEQELVKRGSDELFMVYKCGEHTTQEGQGIGKATRKTSQKKIKLSVWASKKSE